MQRWLHKISITQVRHFSCSRSRQMNRLLPMTSLHNSEPLQLPLRSRAIGREIIWRVEHIRLNTRLQTRVEIPRLYRPRSWFYTTRDDTRRPNAQDPLPERATGPRLNPRK